MRVVSILSALVLAGCVTSAPLKHCDAAMHSQIQTLESEGFVIVGATDEIRPDGIMFLGQFLNVQKEEGAIAVTVDTETLADMLASQSFKQEELCDRGGKSWFMFSKREKVKLETN